MMLRYLISRGWRYIGEELGFSDGIRVERYLETGDGSYLEQIAAYGYEGALRTDRVDKATGILKSSSENYPVQKFKSEQLRLVRALREINNSFTLNHDRIHYFGFDLDTLTGGGYEDIEGLLSTFKDEPAISEILALTCRVHGETAEDEINRLRRVLERAKVLKTSLSKLLGAEKYAALQDWLMTLHDSFCFSLRANSAVDYKELCIAMANREEAMYRHVKAALSKMKPNDKLVLMGHNRHLTKDIGMIKNAGAAPPGGYRVPTIGTYINRLLPGQVFSIWQLHGCGRSSQPYTELASEYVSTKGSINAILSEVGSNFLLPTAESTLLEKETDIVGIYNAIYRTVIAKQADVLFFIGQVSPLRL
ncbi:MAG TPA: erythromycin esterase family protein [Desulfitobacteriaceae bacterium]|nr:erythromycin esterase family protein [Desulfitobacteriaceae bacterium]